MNILIIDNDVMVRLFVSLYENNKDALNRVLSNLQLEYRHIFIPGIVKKEFYCKRGCRKRQKRLSKIKKSFPFVVDCPIKVSGRDIQVINGDKEKDAGEVDAIIQGSRAKSGVVSGLRFNDIVFLSNDEAACSKASSFDIQTLPYVELKNKFQELGIVLPQ